MDYYNIFLDDCRSSYGISADIITFEEFVDKIEKDGLPASISFDHDLGQDEKGINRKNGADCAHWLVNYCIKQKKNLPKWTIHSSNPVGVLNIKSILETFEKHFKF